MKRRLLLVVLLMGGLLLCACVQHDTVAEPEKTFEERLLDGAQPLAENITGEEPRKLSLESVHYGSFSLPSAQELCALFKYESTVHVEGLDRTLAVIYTVEDLKVVASKDLQGDDVQVEYLPSPEGTEVIFCLLSATYHGFTSYYPALFAIEETRWETLAVSLPALNESDRCYLAGQTVLRVDAQDICETYTWNSETGDFEVRT